MVHVFQSDGRSRPFQVFDRPRSHVRFLRQYSVFKECFRHSAIQKNTGIHDAGQPFMINNNTILKILVSLRVICGSVISITWQIKTMQTFIKYFV